MGNTEFVSELKSRIDIRDIVSESVPLKKSGANWAGLCPFHAEKTPSFSVSTTKQIFHCFGCGAGGDVISFVMKRDGVSFREALEVLASRCGMELPRFQPGTAEKRDRLLEMMQAAEGFYTAHLKNDRRARVYLEKRGLDEATVERFSIGAAPDAWRDLQTHLSSRGFSQELMLQGGLLMKGAQGTPYDAFRGRVIVPIRNIYGKTVAFGGRTLDDGRPPKYLNSPQTPLFNKSELLFALGLARDGIRDEGAVLVTEGYMDAIACHQFGFHHAVATLGTAMTASHARLIKRFTRHVTLVFDGDAAGLRAARRGLPILLAEDLEPRVLVLPGGTDPDDFLRQQGPDAFRDALARSKPIVDFLLGAPLEGEERSPQQRATEALRIVAEIPNRILRGQTLTRLAERLGIREAFLAEELDRILRRPAVRSATAADAESVTPAAEVPRGEELLLAAAIDDTGRLRQLSETLSVDAFSHPLCKSIFVRLVRLSSAGQNWDPERLQEEISSEPERSLFNRLRLEAPGEEDEPDQVFADALRHVQRLQSRPERRHLKAQIGQGSRQAMERFLAEQRRLRKKGDQRE